MLARLGTALTFLGLLALVYFLVTFTADRADLRTLLAGAGLAIVGLLLRRRGAPARSDSARFVTVRKVLGRGEGEGNDDAGSDEE
jgi:cytochrome c biogenesis protein CcdA